MHLFFAAVLFRHLTVLYRARSSLDHFKAVLFRRLLFNFVVCRAVLVACSSDAFYVLPHCFVLVLFCRRAVLIALL